MGSRINQSHQAAECFIKQVKLSASHGKKKKIIFQTKQLLRERLLPEHSHTIQGAAHTPPETLPGRTTVPSQRAAPVSLWVPLPTPHTHRRTHRHTDTHTLTLGCSLFPQAESPTQRPSDKFIEWYSGIGQLELVASGEGPRTKKSLGKYTLTV